MDSSFYYPPAERTTALWAERPPPGFLFDVKAFRLLTQHPTPPDALWPDLRQALPAEQAAKPLLYAQACPPTSSPRPSAASPAAWSRSGRRAAWGVVLFQFPRYVYPSRASSRYLEWLLGQLPGLQVAVEFRQHRWMDDEHRGGTLDFLTRHHLAYVCVDEPQGFPGTVPPVATATADVAGVRFHSRNNQTWAVRDASPGRRYAHDYRPEELGEWVPKIRALHTGGRPVHVLMNNCWHGFAVRNARTLAQLLAQDLG